MNIETERLRLRPIKPADKNALFAYRSDAETNRYQGWVPKSISDAEKFINSTAAQINEPGTWFQFVITLKDSGTVIGDAGIHFLDEENMQAELGCTIDKKYHRKGYAYESLTQIIDYLFTELHKHRITASIDPGNAGSIKLFEKLGFRKEAHFIESLFINGKWVDDAVYAMLAKEWKSK